MGTISEKLSYLNETKNAIKEALIEKSVEVADTDTFRSYADKVRSISSGTPTIGSGKYSVKVIDYDGTILKEDNLDAGAVFELPEIPTHSGLVFYEWSCSTTITDNTVTVTNNDIMIGAVYETESGLTEFDIELTKVTGLTVTMQNLTGMTSINWGDGTTDATLTHTYSNYGEYTIKVADVTALGQYIFSQSNSSKNYYLKEARISSTVTSTGGYSFYNCYSLKNVTLPNGITNIPSFSFGMCYSLTTIVIPNSVTSISGFASCVSLTTIVIPNSVTSIKSQAFDSCRALNHIVLPNQITFGGTYIFKQCNSLTNITIPNTVTTITNYAFQSCYSLTKYDFSNHTVVPTLVNTNAFTDINAICKIIVPDSLYDEWIAATNWTTYADYIYKVSEVSE